MRLMLALTFLLLLGAGPGWAEDDAAGSEAPAGPPAVQGAPPLPPPPATAAPPVTVPQAATPAPASPPEAGQDANDPSELVADDIAACAAMLDNFERLTCYDTLAADLRNGKFDGSAPEPERGAEPDKGGGARPNCFLFNGERVCE